MTYTNEHHKQLMAVLTIIAGGVFANNATGWIETYYILTTVALAFVMLYWHKIGLERFSATEELQ